MPIRLLFVIPTLDRNGAEKQLTLLATGLPRPEFDVHVCCLTRGGPLEEPLRAAGVPVTVIGKRWKFDLAAFRRLERFIRDARPDIVHTWIFAANCYGRLAALRARVPHIVAGERCVDPWKRWHELAIDRYLARRTSAIVTNSSGVRDFYAARGIEANRFTVIPNAIQVPTTPPAATRDDVFRELGVPLGVPVLGAVGRLWPQKRYQDLIWALDLMRCVYDDLQLLIIGDGPMRWRLERYTRQVEEDEHVHFLGERPDVPRILPHLDCFWLGSGYEGQSNALMEAMAAGVPVVATDIPGNRDLVVPGETGFLVPVGDRAEFARKTHRLLENADLARRFGTAGRARMASEFTVERMIERHVAFYRELMGPAATR